jgi:glycine cleavage system H protein
MTEPLTFHMGKFPAVLPAELRYARNHMWCQRAAGLSPAGPEGVLRFGFTSYAVRLMQDVYFLDWVVNVGDILQAKQQIGHIETSKAVSDLFAPVAGTLIGFNPDLLKDPTPINVDTYGAGWLFEMSVVGDDTLDAQQYHDFLAAGWEKTQNMLKGHM